MKLALAMVALVGLTGCTASMCNPWDPRCVTPGNSPWDPRISDCQGACEVCEACKGCETCQVKALPKKK